VLNGDFSTSKIHFRSVYSTSAVEENEYRSRRTTYKYEGFYVVYFILEDSLNTSAMYTRIPQLTSRNESLNVIFRVRDEIVRIELFNFIFRSHNLLTNVVLRKVFD
jgi:hypothetical protein